jgi:hypothetical protein
MKNFISKFGEFNEVNEMAIVPRSEKPHRKIEIDLSGPEGNAFYLIGLAKKLYKLKYPERTRGERSSRGAARKFGEDLPSAADLFAEELMSSNYEHLLQVFDEEFGDWVILYR